MRGTAVLRQQKYDGHRSLSRREIQKRRTDERRATLAMLFASWQVPVQCRFSTTGQQLQIRAAKFT